MCHVHARTHTHSYLQFSGVCARLLRQALKQEYRAADIARKESSTIKVFKWKEGKPGKPGKCKSQPSLCQQNGE